MIGSGLPLDFFPYQPTFITANYSIHIFDLAVDGCYLCIYRRAFLGCCVSSEAGTDQQGGGDGTKLGHVEGPIRKNGLAAANVVQDRVASLSHAAIDDPAGPIRDKVMRIIIGGCACGHA
jgi:hypothetical protein